MPLRAKTIRHTCFTLLCLHGLFFGNAQEPDIIIRDTIRIPATTEPSFPEETVRDTIPANSTVTDTIPPKKEEMLKDVVDYFGKDYVLMDRVENKAYLYNEAWVTYEDMRIDAGYIMMDYERNEVYAKGIIDSAGNYVQPPVFVQGPNQVEPDSIRFNFDTYKALVYNSRTEDSGFNILGETTKKINDSVVFMRNVKFTTAKDIDNPEYYFYAPKVKFVPGSKVVTGTVNMWIADVPTPIGMPFGYFPLEADRASGFIIPTIGENNQRGFFFQNGGYYFAVSDYFDLTTLGDYYTNGSYGLRAESNYAWRYRFRGNLSFRYENLILSERGFPDFSERTIYNLRWSHNQDAKANPSSRFSASVNLGSSRYYQESINQTNTSNQLNNTLSSSINYSKTFEIEPMVNLNLTATHTQNTQTQVINMTLPTLTANVARIFPFAPKAGGKKGALQNINFQYDLNAQNRFTTTDSLFFKREMFDQAEMGARHTIPLTTNFKLLRWLSASMGGTFQETWVGDARPLRFDAAENRTVRDTIKGFDSYRTYNFNTSLGTTVYGMFSFGEGKKIEAIRHVVRPTVGYGISPGFEQYWDSLRYTPEVGGALSDEEIQLYSRFENTLFGAPGRQLSSTISMGLGNVLEAKVRDRDSTATEAKKINLLNNLNFNTSYNIAADSLKWSPLRVTGSIPVVKQLDISFDATLDPYALDHNNRRINTFNIDNGGSLFRLSGAGIRTNYSFSSKDFKHKRPEGTDASNETFRNGGRPDDLFGDSNDFSNPSMPAGQVEEEDEEEDPTDIEWYHYSIPWDLRIAYTMTYNNNARQKEISSHSIMLSGNVELSPRWSVGASSGYDLKNKGFTFTQFRFFRDLESWQMSFNWVPFGTQGSWYFFIGIKASMLSDIKYDKRREPDRRF